MAEAKRRRRHKNAAPLSAAVPEHPEADALLHEHATMVRDDEEEVYDLGFIVEDHDEAHEVDFRVANLAAEREAAEFAEANQLLADPYDEGLTTVLGDEDDVAADLDDDQRPDRVNLLGRSPGISTGFGCRVAQDIGPDGFAIRDNPLLVPAEELDYPISTEPVSEEALGLRDVDEMGSEEELDRLADRGARLEERASRRRRRSDQG